MIPPIDPKQVRINMAKLGSMNTSVNRRRYVAPSREAAAARTRDRILSAARALFAAYGYDGTAVAEIASRAGVSVDTVYAAVGRKPDLIRQLVDQILGEGRGAVPAEQRRYVQELRAAETGESKIGIYARALGRLMPDVAPLLLALRDAGTNDPECERVWSQLVERRAANMLLFAADLRATGEARVDLDDQTVADVVWATNSPEYFTLLRSRGWSSERYAAHLADLWCRHLLESSPAANRHRQNAVHHQ
jgi:AcrR family transcriptional regulator